jgi:hypothetical protein
VNTAPATSVAARRTNSEVLVVSVIGKITIGDHHNLDVALFYRLVGGDSSGKKATP